MKVPVPHSPRNPKSLPCNSTTDSANSNCFFSHSIIDTTFCQEPNSVLDICRSPSPVKTRVAGPLDYLEDDYVCQSFDWDSIMKELDFTNGISRNDNLQASYPSLSELLPPLSPQMNSNQHQQFMLHPEVPDLCGAAPVDYSPTRNQLGWNNYCSSSGLDYCIQELLRAADCLDYNELQLAHLILDRLANCQQNQRAVLHYSPSSNPLHRAASLFREALQSMLSPSITQLSSFSDVVHIIRTYKSFSVLSPIPMFIQLTTNQAILDSITEFPLSHSCTIMPTNTVLHVVDFDIGFGCQYASLMKELASASLSSSSPDRSCKISPCLFLRVTAVVTEDYKIEPTLIKESLTQFANDLDVHFQIEFVSMKIFDILSFKSVKVACGEKTAVILTQNVFRRLGVLNNMMSFVTEMRKISPSIVITTESEGWAAAASMNSISFRKGLVNCLEFYSLVFDSLDVAVTSVANDGGDWARKVELLLLKPRIFAAMEGRRTGASGLSWKEAFYGVGFRPVQQGRFTDFQAECLLGKVQVRGFDVARRQPDLVLCWHQRPLIATSAWTCS